MKTSVFNLPNLDSGKTKLYCDAFTISEIGLLTKRKRKKT